MNIKSSIFLAIGLLLTIDLYGQLPDVPIPHLRRLLATDSADTNRVNHLIHLSLVYVIKPGEHAHDLDSAMLLSRQAYTLSQTLHYGKGMGYAYYVIGRAFWEKRDIPRSQYCAGRAIELFTQNKCWGLIGHVYEEQTRYYNLDRHELPKKIALYQKALRYFRLANDRVKQADMLKELADLHQIQEDYTQALAELQSALALYRSAGHTDLETVYDLLGFVSTKLGDYKEGLAFGLLAIQVAEARKDYSLQRCTIYNRVGITYREMGQFDQAKLYFQKSLAVALQHADNAYILHLVGNLADLLLRQGKAQQALVYLQQHTKRYPPTNSESELLVAIRFLMVYTELQQFAQAQYYCEQALTILAAKGNGSLGQAFIYQAVIRFFITSRQFDKALHYLASNDARCRENGSVMALAKNHWLWFKLDSTQLRYTAAIQHYQRYKALQDSLLNTTKSRQIAQLEIQFETEKKDQDLKLHQHNIQLLTRQSQLQQTQLKQDRLIRNGMIAGALMLVLLLGLLFNRYQFKQRSNQLLEAKQREINQKNQSLQQVVTDKDQLLEEREWMLREIHHRVKNNLQIITSLLHSQATFLKDRVAQTAIRESRNRVHAMALIHQKLYQSNRLSSIPMGEYIHEIIDYLIESFDRANTIKQCITIAPAELDVTIAVPLGLIINEAVTNALKFAFPEHQPGTLVIDLIQIDHLTYHLIIRDDGVGLPVELNPSLSSTLGMSLIRGLSKQLGGKLEISQNNGVQIQLAFSIEQVGQPDLEKV